MGKSFIRSTIHPDPTAEIFPTPADSIQIEGAFGDKFL